MTVVPIKPGMKKPHVIVAYCRVKHLFGEKVKAVTARTRSEDILQANALYDFR